MSIINRDLSLLYPPFAKLVQKSLDECHSKKLMIYVFEGLRTPQRSDELFAQGRTKPGKIITNARALQSWHNFGCAVDLAFDGDEREGIQWSWNGDYGWAKMAKPKRDQWQSVGEIFEKNGVEWAGRWVRFPEMAHFQLVPKQITLVLAATLYKNTNSNKEFFEYLDSRKVNA